MSDDRAHYAFVAAALHPETCGGSGFLDSGIS
jgi:hypothetical protein